MTTVDDVLAARPESLRSRARKARFAQLDSEARRIEHECVDLETELWGWFRDALGMTEPEMAELSFQHSQHNPERGLVSVVVDGIRFQARYKIETIMELKSSNGFETEKITDREIHIEAKGDNSSWKTVKTLADVGSLV